MSDTMWKSPELPSVWTKGLDLISDDPAAVERNRRIMAQRVRRAKERIAAVIESAATGVTK